MTSGSDFIAKIKAANDAIGFIAVAMKGLDALSQSENPAETVKTYSYNGKNMLDAQAFDTPVGIIEVSFDIGDLNLYDPFLKDKIDKARVHLKSAKESLAAPVTAMRVDQELKLKSQAQGNNPIINKLNNLLDDIEVKANRVGNQIF